MSDEPGPDDLYSGDPAALDAQDQAAPERAVDTDAGIDAAINAAIDKHAGDDRARDPLGRFAPKVQEARAAIAKAQQDTIAAKPPAEAAKPAEAAAVPGALPQAPASWGKDAAPLWAKAPPELQAFLAKREEQIARGFARYEGVAEYADLAERNGQNLRTVLGTVKMLEDLFEQDPVGAIQVMAQRAGIDFGQIAAAIGQRAEMRAAAPQSQPQEFRLPPALAQELGALRAQVQQLSAKPFMDEVSAFYADPANKHIKSVETRMEHLLRADRNLSLKDAYDQACWADPQVRAQMLAEQDAARKAEEAKRLATTTQTAQRAAKSLSPGNVAPLNGARPRGMSIDESIADAFARHT